ncbi:transcriptional regulator, GntR family [Lacrimispora sphenoides]|jgi:DNA-binding transcriptional MocR family regulator|uniref:aminotransferase-like domain-containing protein n=1 Tax=Lacrimispora sphenoides TaxID=29370 RepID=UPI0008C9DA24|nr:PLP-dependent aminotransferase family protein [Lacrimispora sphenoides]SET88762.1 transcriptional regulator, GntR family [Lacrimispora sphenoides]
MPINSFENYPMSWTPDKQKLTFPFYYCLADMLEQEIKSGKLTANTKLPPQRELADYMDLNLSTITKAYKLCEMRGLIHAITGKGTFVTPYANVSTSTVEKIAKSKIELAVIHPFYESNTTIRDLTIEILKKPFSEQLFEYSHPLGDRGQILTAARWLKRSGLEADEHNTMIAAGAQNALATILSSLFEAGDCVAVDIYTYPNFISLANLLYLQLVPIENDGAGMLPDRLENACTLRKIKGIYMMPAGGNPTNIAFSESRKREIGEIIRKKNLIAIEDDNYAVLLEEPYTPLALEAPEHCIYISGLSKPLCPGLRIAYMHLPDQFIEIMEQGMFSQNLKISSLNMEIAAEIIRSGLDRKIIQKKRKATVKRNQIYASYFPESRTYMESYYQWLYLPEHRTGRICEMELSRQGISVFGAERFLCGNQGKTNAVRVATCSAESDGQLRKGLEGLKNFIQNDRLREEPLFIV